jgi:hypothetical protein
MGKIVEEEWVACGLPADRRESLIGQGQMEALVEKLDDGGRLEAAQPDAVPIPNDFGQWSPNAFAKEVIGLPVGGQQKYGQLDDLASDKFKKRQWGAICLMKILQD